MSATKPTNPETFSDETLIGMERKFTINPNPVNSNVIQLAEDAIRQRDLQAKVLATSRLLDTASEGIRQRVKDLRTYRKYAKNAEITLKREDAALNQFRKDGDAVNYFLNLMAPESRNRKIAVAQARQAGFAVANED